MASEHGAVSTPSPPSDPRAKMMQDLYRLFEEEWEPMLAKMQEASKDIESARYESMFIGIYLGSSHTLVQLFVYDFKDRFKL